MLIKFSVKPLCNVKVSYVVSYHRRGDTLLYTHKLAKIDNIKWWPGLGAPGLLVGV